MRIALQMGQRARAAPLALPLYLEALAIRLSRGTVIGTAFCVVQLEGRPVPGHEHAAMITLPTPRLEDWAVNEGLLLDIARSLQVEQTHPDFIR